VFGPQNPPHHQTGADEEGNMKKVKLTNAERERRGKGRVMELEANKALRQWIKFKEGEAKQEREFEKEWKFERVIGITGMLYRSKTYQECNGQRVEDAGF
jgi:hypothetical protein